MKFRQPLVLILIGILSLSMFSFLHLACATSRNLVTNGGFETGDLTGWTVESGQTPSVRSDEHHSGNYCVATTYITKYYYHFTLSQKLPQLPTSMITQVSCWFKYGFKVNGVDFDFFALNYTDGSVSNVTCQGIIPSWVQYSITPLPGKTIDSVIIQQLSDWTIIACWDGVSVTETTPGVALISPANTTYAEAVIPLTFSVDEETSWIGYSLDNQPNQTITGNTTLTDLTVGQHSIRVYANDTLGNMGVSEPVDFTVVSEIVPDDYPTIQAAINAASDGDTVFVRNGTYYEHLVVNKTLSLIGENCSNTIIDGSNATSPIVWIRAANTSFIQFTILNASQGGEGIIVQDSSNISINNNIVELATFGIMVQGCSNVTVQNNTLTENGGHGLVIDWSTSVTAVGNSIFENQDDGIYVYDSQNCTLKENLVSDNHWSGICIQSGSGNMIMKNNISNNDHVGGIWLFDGTASNNVRGNTILNNSRGVYIGFWTSYYSEPQGNLIINNILEGNNIGINIDYCKANVIYHNQIDRNDIQSIVRPGYSNVWDNSYPSGGNYWSDYSGNDTCSGAYQNETGSDGMGDTPYIIDANNTDNYPLMNPRTPPDIAVTSLITSKTVIGQGYSGLVNVTFENLGSKIEAFNATVYANSTAIRSEQIMLAMTNSTMSFMWNTTGLAYGNYAISACVEPLPEETNISNNNCTGSWIVVAGVGDLTGGTPNAFDFIPDGKVRIEDVAVVAKFFGQNVPPAPPNCDLSGITVGVPDGKIDITDVATVAKHFGEHYSYP